jgi:hypothetical protein
MFHTVGAGVPLRPLDSIGVAAAEINRVESTYIPVGQGARKVLGFAAFRVVPAASRTE